MKNRMNGTIIRVTVGFAVITIAAMLVFAADIASAQEAVLYNFSQPSGGLYMPIAPLIADSAGNLYGTTELGGPAGMGGVFELSPPAVAGGPWTETTLYSFLGSPDAGEPAAGLVMDANGALYGTTTNGGPDFVGTVFQLTPPTVQGGAWTESVLYSFTGGSDGANPLSTLVFDKSGNLYGTTSSGTGDGVFQLTPPSVSGGTWGFNSILTFSGGLHAPGGCRPFAGLLPGPAGSFYGTTSGCGANEGGVAFKITPPANGGAWTETVLHTFGAYNTKGDGNQPESSLVLGTGGVLFGTTHSGGANNLGAVFELVPPATQGGVWTENILHSFARGEGNYPVAPVKATPKALFGTAEIGGAQGQGTVFKLTPPAVVGDPWTETTVFSFTDTGSIPEAGLFLYKGALYGTASLGGTPGGGTVYQIY